MFYGQCWKCGERWELGTASTCKCPEELPAYTFKPTKPVLVHRGFKPNHNMTFHNQHGKQIGVLDFNGPEMTFTGDADESAKLFFDLIARSFKARLDQERADERKVCSQTRAGKPRELKPAGRGALLDEQQYCFDKGWREGAASVRAAIRARSNT